MIETRIFVIAVTTRVRQRFNKALTPSQASRLRVRPRQWYEPAFLMALLSLTANARIKRMRRAGTLSPRAIEKHFGKFMGGGNKFGKFADKYGDKYGGKDQQPIDASSR